MFASPFKGGKLPYNPYGIQENRLEPAAREIGFPDTLAWHSFRHSYRTMLDEAGAPLSVRQELMRLADSRQTLEYGEGMASSKRAANVKVVAMVMPKSKRTLTKRGKWGRR